MEIKTNKQFVIRECYCLTYFSLKVPPKRQDDPYVKSINLAMRLHGVLKDNTRTLGQKEGEKG